MGWLTWEAVGVIVGALVIFLGFQLLGVWWERFKGLGSSSVSHPRQGAATAVLSPHNLALYERRQRIVMGSRAYRARKLAVRTSKPVLRIPANQSIPRDIIKTAEISDKQRPLIEELINIGWSANKVLTLLGGDRATRLAQIRAIKAEMDADRLARVAPNKSITDADVRYVPPLVEVGS